MLFVCRVGKFRIFLLWGYYSHASLKWHIPSLAVIRMNREMRILKPARSFAVEAAFTQGSTEKFMKLGASQNLKRVTSIK